MQNETVDANYDYFGGNEFHFVEKFRRKFVSNFHDYKEFLNDTEIMWIDFCDNSKDFAYISNKFVKYFTRLKNNVISSCPDREIYEFMVRWFGMNHFFECGDINEKRLLMVLKLKGLSV